MQSVSRHGLPGGGLIGSAKRHHLRTSRLLPGIFKPIPITLIDFVLILDRIRAYGKSNVNYNFIHEFPRMHNEHLPMQLSSQGFAGAGVRADVRKNPGRGDAPFRSMFLTFAPEVILELYKRHENELSASSTITDWRRVSVDAQLADTLDYCTRGMSSEQVSDREQRHRLPQTTDWNIPQIAEACGYRARSRFSLRFRERFGCPRRKHDDFALSPK